MKTIIYNIDTLAGILPSDVRRLEGSEMNHVECIENAYLVIEDGIITEFGQDVSGCSGIQSRATPLAAGGRSDEVAEGVVLNATATTDILAKFCDDAIFDHHVCIHDAFNGVHLGALKLQLSLRQDSRQGSYVVDYCLHE